MQRTYYSQWRWITVASMLAVPTIGFVINGFRDTSSPSVGILYILIGCILTYGFYWLIHKENLVSNITIGDGQFVWRWRRIKISTEIKNIQRIERAERGIWRLVLREPIRNHNGTEINQITLPEFSNWRKAKWREALGSEIEIVT